MWGSVAFLGGTRTLIERLAAQATCAASEPLGDLLGYVPLHGDRPRATPFGEMLGGPGLDARRFTDLSKLEPDRLITPSNEVFVRTAAPIALRTSPLQWTIQQHTMAGQSVALPIDALRRDARAMGAHLIECSGNTDPDNFGLISVAEWHGVPLARVLSTLDTPRDAWGVLVSGVDDVTVPTRSSTPGASWVFPLESVDRLGAFLATRMNDEPLPPDHGAPVRLVVPGWYGCSWIKWVNELRLVGREEPSTLQMREFSTRTHQRDVPMLARQYEAPVIDLAATPVRVEKRRVNGRLEYRIVGIVWGGEQPIDRLAIRFNAGEAPNSFAVCPPPRTHRTWSLWEYRWRPTSPGVYNIALKAADPSIRTRRLDSSFYVRRVVIDEI